MTTLREAAQQALEALEYAQQDRECPSTTRQAITALKSALAEPKQDGCDHCNHPLYAAIKCKVCGRATEPVQEPVTRLFGTLPVYDTPPQRKPAQEPQCNLHPKAPHGFLRNASHTEGRYVCECEYWNPYEAGYQAGMEAALRAQS